MELGGIGIRKWKTGKSGQNRFVRIFSPSAEGGRSCASFKSNGFCRSFMRGLCSSKSVSSALVCLLLFPILSQFVPTPILEEKSRINQVNDSLTDNGDGTWTVFYPVDEDTTLDSGNMTAQLSNSQQIQVGWTSGRQETRIGLFGINLDDAGFPTNTTIVNASLTLHPVLPHTSPVDVQVWNVHRSDWVASQASWVYRNSNDYWAAPGALGNLDSGSWQSRDLVFRNTTATHFDVTKSVELANYKQTQNPVSDVRVGLLLTPGHQSAPGIVNFHSSESANISARPILRITFEWSQPISLAQTPSWIDVEPRLGIIDADSSLDLDAMIRSERGEVISASSTWTTTSGTIDGTGRLSPTTSGLVSIGVSGAGIEDSHQLLVIPGSPLGMVMAQENYSITADDTVPIVAYGIDQHGNYVPGLTFIWSVSSGNIDSNGLFTPTEIGQHTVVAQWGSHVAASNITVGVGGAFQIIIPEDLTARAGIGKQIIPVVEDRFGNSLPLGSAAGIDWSVESGSIDSAGYFVGQEVGIWQLNATSGVGANGSGWISVNPGLVNSLEIIGPNRIVYADEAVPLDLRWHDRVGNNVSVLLPLENWTSESGNFRVNNGMVEWLPSQEGTWRLAAQAEGVETWIDVVVENGEIVRVWIDAEHDIMTADDVSDLTLQAEDIRGNRWPISAEWSVVETIAESCLVSDIQGTRFVGGVAGIWTIQAKHIGQNQTFESETSIDVRPGRLARILLDGDGETISADDSYDLNPRMSDADGNLIAGIQLNWTIDGYDVTPQLRLSDGIWLPSEIGDYLIEADAAGRNARSRIYVEQGLPHTIHVEISLPPDQTVASGQEFQISTFAEDLDGNRAPWDVEWEIPDDSLEVELTMEVGVYDAKGLSQGDWNIEVFNGTAYGNFTIKVVTGEPRGLRIGQHSGGGLQGEVMTLEVNLVDYGGNTVPVQTSMFVFDTTAGQIRHDIGSYWILELENPGPNQVINVRYESWESETYVDVEPTGIDKLTSTQGGQILIGGFAVALLMIPLLLYITRRNSESEPHWDDEFEFIESEIEAQSESVIRETTLVQNETLMSRRSRRKLLYQKEQMRTQNRDSTAALEEAENVNPSSTSSTTQTSSVLQAMDGTVQGQSGWYSTAQGEAQYWTVDSAGSWERVS